MNFTGSMLYNAFPGDDNRRPMTRAIVRIGAREYAVFLNISDEGTIAAVHAVTGRNGNSPLIDKNALALSVCSKITDIDKCEWLVERLEFDGVTVENFAVTAEMTNPNDNQYRLSMPVAIARVRFGKPKGSAKAEDAATGTNGI